jgi:hypothetical protein
MLTRTRPTLLACCALLLLSTACGKGEDQPKETLGEDWSGRALDQKTSGTVSAVGFSLTLPAKMKLDVDDADRKEWLADKDDYFGEPSVTISVDAIPPKDIDGAVADMMVGKEDVIVRRDTIEAGFIVTYHSKNKGLLKTRVWKKAGDKTITCSAGQAKTGGVPNFDATRAWLEKLCLSMKPS